MIYFLLILIFLFILLNIVSKKFDNPYRLIMIFGKKGSGKTTYFTKLSLKYKRLGRIVYSNVPIYGARLFNIRDIGKRQFEPDSVILIDEVKMIWDSRDFKNFPPEVRNFFVLQRHYRNTVYLASQQFNIDKTLRDLCDDLYLLVNVSNIFSFAKRISKRITIHNGDENGQESFLTEDYRFKPFWTWHFTFIPKYVYFFDSFETTDLKPIKYQLGYRVNPFLEFLSVPFGYPRYLFAQLKYDVARYIVNPYRKISHSTFFVAYDFSVSLFRNFEMD